MAIASGSGQVRMADNRAAYSDGPNHTELEGKTTQGENVGYLHCLCQVPGEEGIGDVWQHNELNHCMM